METKNRESKEIIKNVTLYLNKKGFKFYKNNFDFREGGYVSYKQKNKYGSIII